jgi:hypothetical protein
VSDTNKPITRQGNLAKLPRALAPLIARPQWVVWKWTEQGAGWQKPPFMATQPQRHASTKDPSTWADYATALDAVEMGEADGISYILTEDDPVRRSILITAATSTRIPLIRGRSCSSNLAVIPIRR